MPTGNQEGCPPLKFSIPIEDLDVEDKIAVLWFIDPTGLQDENPQRRTVLDRPLKGTRRSAEIELGVTGATPLAQVRSHLVEVVVSDDDSISTRSPEPRPLQEITLPDGGFAIDRNYVDSYVWVVNTRNEPCQ